MPIATVPQPKAMVTLHPGRLSLQPVQESDLESMVAVRIAAMRPSLEHLGRFDPQRARERLVDAFAPAYMHHLVLDGTERVGFMTLKPETQANGDCLLRLEHLYVLPTAQGQGIGYWAMQCVFRQAGTNAVRLTALRDSPANAFYQGLGFVMESEDGVDLHYCRQPELVKP